MSTRRIAEWWGAAIRARRVRLDLTVADLARALGVSRSAIYDWENGRCAPTAERLPDIARALRVDPRQLFTYPDDVSA